MKGIQPGSLCIILPLPHEGDWAWAVVKVTKSHGIINDDRVYFSGDYWWYVEAQDGVSRPLNGCLSTQALFPESVLMPIDPLNDAARERAAQKLVSA